MADYGDNFIDTTANVTGDAAYSGTRIDGQSSTAIGGAPWYRLQVTGDTNYNATHQWRRVWDWSYGWFAAGLDATGQPGYYSSGAGVLAFNIAADFDVLVDGTTTIYFRILNASNWYRVSTRDVPYQVGQTWYSQVWRRLEKCQNGTITQVFDEVAYPDASINRIVCRGSEIKLIGGRHTYTYTPHPVHGSAFVAPGQDKYVSTFTPYWTRVYYDTFLQTTGIGVGFPSGRVFQVEAFTFEPNVPTLVSPTNNAVVNTGTPTLTATVNQFHDYSYTSKLEWQIATNTAFTTGLVSFTEPDSAYKISGNSSYTIPEVSSLDQGVQYYIRARQRWSTGEVGPWAAYRAFTVSHAPIATNLTPTGGQGVQYSTSIRVDWDFTDTSTIDSQTAYRAVLERATGVAVADTGKLTNSNEYHVFTITSALKDVALRWRVMLWDEEDVAGGWSPYQVFTPGDLPTVQITSPTGTIASSKPLIQWNFTATNNRTQSAYRVTVGHAGTGVPTFDTGTIVSSANSHQTEIPVVSNGNSYDIRVYLTDNTGLTGSAMVTLPAEYEAPDDIVFTADASMYDTSGYVLVTWTYVPDQTFEMWRIYRRKQGDTEWTIAGEFTDESVTEFHDWFVGSQDTYEYQVVQVVLRFGEQVESSVTTPATVTVSSGWYWLVDVLDPDTNSLKLHMVKDDQYSSAMEQSSYLIVGRGRHADIGEYIGIAGQMTAQLRDDANSTARQKKLALENFRLTKRPAYLKTPFGDLWQVALGEIQISRIAGVGGSEFVDVSFSYEEVI